MSKQVKYGQEKRGRRGKKKKQPGKKKQATPVMNDNNRVYFTPDGAQYMVLDVGGGGLCALLGVIALAMFAAGVPFEVIFATVSGELTDDIKEYVQYLRAIIVSTCGDQFVFKDGEELASFDDVIHDSIWELMTPSPNLISRLTGGVAAGEVPRVGP